jgi:hypothetical protein
MRFAIAATFALTVIGSPALSQSGSIDALSLQSGARARILGPAADSKYIHIRVDSASPDSLRYTLDGSVEARSLSWQQIRKMDASAGRSRHFWRGAGVGFLLGAIGGAIVGSRNTGEMRGFYTVATGLIAGAAGAVGGGILGSAAGSEKWMPVTLPRK